MSALSRRLRRTLAVVTFVAFAAALSACAPTVALEPADDAAEPACADVVVRLPDTVAELDRRETNAQGTGAWGSPTAVLLRCGVAVPGPTSDRCVSVDDVDWILDESDAPRYRLTTYGRTPAVEIIVDNELVSGTTAAADLSPAVAAIPADGACTNPEPFLE